MSKYLKSLLIAGLVVCMTVCLGIFAAACNNDDGNGNDGEDSTFPSSVQVTVLLEDETPAVGVGVQLCAVKSNGELGLCLQHVITNAQGVSTISIDEANGKNYEIHLGNLPEGYNYVDANDVPYIAEEGDRIDVTTDSPYTITLKKPVVTSHVLEFNTETEALADHTYNFTAPEAGYYLFTCDDTQSGSWKVNNETVYGNDKTIRLDKDATATVAVNNDCNIKVATGEEPEVGTSDNPLALTLGADPVSFSRELGEGYSALQGKMVLTWKESFHATFTAATAGQYKVTFTSSVNNDSLYVAGQAGNSYINFDALTSTSAICLVSEECTANTTYTLTFDTDTSDYYDLVETGVTSVDYTVKIELYDPSTEVQPPVSGDNEYTTVEDLDIGENKRQGGNYEYFLTCDNDGVYTISVDNGVALTVNEVAIEGTSTTVEYDSSNMLSSPWISIRVNANCTITITFTPA